MNELTQAQQTAIRNAWQAALDVLDALAGEETTEAAATINAASDFIEAARVLCPPCDPTDG